MLGISILLGFSFAGLLLNQWLHIPLPSNVISLLLFTAGLFTKAIKLEWVESAAQFLQGNMMLFFVPSVAGVLAFAPFLAEHWLVIGVALVTGTIVVLYTTAATTSFMIRRRSE